MLYSMRNLFILAAVISVLCTACTNTEHSSKKTFNTTPVDLKKMTPAMVLNQFVEAFKNGDHEKANMCLSKEKIKKHGMYDVFPPQKIENVMIKADKERTGDEKTAYYILKFDVVEESDPRFFMAGEVYFFVKMVFEDDIWKVDQLATSP